DDAIVFSHIDFYVHIPSVGGRGSGVRGRLRTSFPTSGLRPPSPGPCLNHFRREADDLHEPLLAQFAGDGAEDARTYGFIVRLDNHRRVLIKADISAILAARLFARADDDGAYDLAFLDGAIGRGFLHRRRDDIAEPGAQSGVTAER